MKYFLFLISILCLNENLVAQTADQIITNYFNNTGGIENWRSLEGVLIKSTVKENGMEIPSTRITLQDGRLLIKFTMQDKEIVQVAFDGKEAWGDDFMTLEAKKNSLALTNNLIKATHDFPHPLLNYKENGYVVELLGKEIIDKKEYFKVKLTMKKHIIDDQNVDNIKYYYFDPDSYKIRIVASEIQTGTLKGKLEKIAYKDYRQVGKVSYPFSIVREIDGMKSTNITIKSVELNPQVDDSIFIFPIKK